MKTCPKCHTENPVDSRFCQNCGFSLLEVQGEQSDPYLGRTFATKFLVQQVLGAGAMGKVYLCEHLSLGKLVCIKILHPHLAEDKSLTKRFHREARAASRLNHPNSIQIIDFGANETGVLYIAMEYVAGEDLRRVIKRDFPFTPQRIVRLLGQVLSALEEAHAQGVIHRDLKPENIMVVNARAERDLIKVLDFGIAKIQEPGPEGGTLTVAGIVCGTPEYMAPEQARGDPLDARVDLYAAGIILYQLLTGELPFKADSALATVTKHLTEQPIPPHLRKPDLAIDPRLEAICLRALSKDREQRFPSALVMKAELEAVLHGIELSSPGFALPPPAGAQAPYAPSAPHLSQGQQAPSGQQWPSGAPRPGSNPASSVHSHAAIAYSPTFGSMPAQPAAGGAATPSFGGMPSAATGGGSGPSFVGGPLPTGPTGAHQGPTQTGGTQTPLAFAMEDGGPPGRREKAGGGLAAWIAAGAIVLLGGTGVVLWKLEVGPFGATEHRPSGRAAAATPAPEAVPAIPVEPTKPLEALKQAEPSKPPESATVDGGAPAVAVGSASGAAADAGSKPAEASAKTEEDDPKKPRRVARAPGQDPEAALRAAMGAAGKSVTTNLGSTPPTPTPPTPRSVPTPTPPKEDPPRLKIPPRDPMRAQKAYEDGLRAVKARNMSAAIAKLKEAVLYSPATPEFHRDLARAHRMAGQARNAIWHYNKYQQLAPGAPDLEVVKKFVGAP